MCLCFVNYFIKRVFFSYLLSWSFLLCQRLGRRPRSQTLWILLSLSLWNGFNFFQKMHALMCYHWLIILPYVILMNQIMFCTQFCACMFIGFVLHKMLFIFKILFLCEIDEIKETIFIFLKSCLVGLDFHLPFGVSSCHSCCLQSLAISDQVLKTYNQHSSINFFSSQGLHTYNLCYKCS